MLLSTPDSLFGILKYDVPAMSIEEMNEAIRDGWAGIT
jgi:hypothetical protein